MDRIKANKEIVLKALKTNRTKHIEDYKIALRGYRVESAKLLEKMLARVEEGKTFSFENFYELEKPETHEKDYDLAIEMLEMDVDINVELTTQQFSFYIKDDWHWKRTFSSGLAHYGSSGSSGTSGTAGYTGTTGDKIVNFSKDEL